VATWRRSLGWLLLVWLVYGATRYAWTLWRRRETARLDLIVPDDGWGSVLGTFVALQAAVAGFALLPGVGVFWTIVLALMFGLVVTLSRAEPKAPAAGPRSPDATTSISRAERSAHQMGRAFFFIGMLVAVPLAMIGGIQDFREWLARVFAWRPSWLVAVLLLLAALVIASYVLVGLVFLNMRIRRWRAGRANAGASRTDADDR
jgi:hypothetical protein